MLLSPQLFTILLRYCMGIAMTLKMMTLIGYDDSNRMTLKIHSMLLDHSLGFDQVPYFLPSYCMIRVGQTVIETPYRF